MRIIDEKGRIFGKINIIDFSVILFFLFILPVGYIGYKFLAKEEPKRIEVEITSRITKLPSKLLEIISVGDKELDEKGQVIGEIISLGLHAPYMHEFDLGKGYKITKEAGNFVQLDTKLMLKAKIEKNELYYKNDIIKLDFPLNFSTAKYSVSVVPVKLEKIKERVMLVVKFESLLKDISEIVKVGDEQTEITEEINGGKRCVAKVVEIVSNEPAEIIRLMEESTNETGWQIIGHPNNRNLVLKMDVLCEQREGGLFFLGDQPVKAGLPFTFAPDIYSIKGVIVGMKGK